MKRPLSQFGWIVQMMAVSSLMISVSLAAQSASTVVVTLSPGDDVQGAVSAKPEATTFVLLPGVYRMQRIAPKNGDVFEGQGTVILNGSQVLKFQLDPTGSGFWTATANAGTWFYGACQTAHPQCGWAQDLFIDNVLQTPAHSIQDLKKGFWYFDRGRNQVYVPVDPTGHIVEIGMTEEAFYGSASNVEISNLTVEKYAAPMQFGGIGGQTPGTGWIITNVESRWNHGVGIRVRSGSKILNSFCHHNGELGILGVGANIQVANSELAWNNYAGFIINNEAGGAKFLLTTSLTLQSNYVHDNVGPGIWTDTDNVNTLVDGNVITHNTTEGILDEASYAAIIRNNTIKGNGYTGLGGLWNSQILLQDSSNVQVYANTVEVPQGGGNGIGLINYSRPSGAMGAHVTSNNLIHDNTVIYLSSTGQTGVVSEASIRGTAVGNEFNSNHYILQVGDASVSHWVWFDSVDWDGFRAGGQEALGTCCN